MKASLSNARFTLINECAVRFRTQNVDRLHTNCWTTSVFACSHKTSHFQAGHSRNVAMGLSLPGSEHVQNTTVWFPGSSGNLIWGGTAWKRFKLSEKNAFNYGIAGPPSRGWHVSDCFDECSSRSQCLVILRSVSVSKLVRSDLFSDISFHVVRSVCELAGCWSSGMSPASPNAPFMNISGLFANFVSGS